MDTHSNPALQRFAIFVEEGLFNVSEINFGTADNDSDESLVVCAKTLHWIVQALSEEAHFALNAFY